VADQPPNKPVLTIQGHESSYDHLVTGLAIQNTAVPDTMNDRIRQQQVIPAAIKGRLMQPVQDNGGVILTVAGYIPNTKSATATVTTTSTNKGMVISEVYWQLYWDQKTADHRIPQNTDVALYPFYTWNPIYDSVGTPISTQPGKTISAITVRNSTGATLDKLVIFEAYVRMVINGSGQTSG
jgi:hypothetical protein